MIKYLLLTSLLASCSYNEDLTVGNCVINSEYLLKVISVNRVYGEKVYKFELIQDFTPNSTYTYDEDSRLHIQTLDDNGFKKVDCPK